MKQNHNYETDNSLQEILEKMRKNTFYNFHNYNISSINKVYLNIRSSLFKVLQNITMKMNFKSQTYFLSTYYLDIIFMKKKKINFNLYKIGLAALCLSAKFCENDPNVPQLQYFMKNYNSIMGYKNLISLSDLMYAEVLVCKLLDYKLNYYTIYDFNAFFFCHGILKLDQIKEIEKDFKKNNKTKKKEISINTSFVKNILGKIYNKSRYYLDIVNKLDKICFKYSPIFIAVFIVKTSIEEILSDEYNKILSEKKDTDDINQKEKEEFTKKNCQYFTEIMNDFYKIDYENSEQYKQLILDDEIKKIFNKDDKTNSKEKNQDNSKEKKIINDKENKENEKNEKNEKNKMFNNSVNNGFYKRLKITLNNDINNLPEDFQSNLNINKFQKSQLEKIDNAKKAKRIPISRKNTYNTTDNNLNQNKNKFNKKIEIKTECDSPIRIKKKKSTKNLNVKNLNKNKKQKYNTLNEITNQTFDNKEGNNEIKIKKKPYLRKFITLNSKEISNSYTNSIKASTTTHFYSSKINQLSSSNNVYLDSNYSNSKMIIISEYNNDKKRNNSYNKVHLRKPSKNQKLINTSVGTRYKKHINYINKKDISNEKRNNINKTENIKSSTDNNFYPNKIKKINVNTNKEPEIENINIDKEIRSKRLSNLLATKNSKLNNTLKEINKSFRKNIIDEFNKSGCVTTRFNKNDGILLNKVNKNKKGNKFEKLNINKYLMDNKNKYISNKKAPINNKKINKLLISSSKNNPINVQNIESFKKISFRNTFNSNSINNINSGSLTTRDYKIDYNEKVKEVKDQLQSSINQIIQKTKNFFSKNKKEENIENKELPNNNFYKSQQNFYKSKIENKEQNIKYNNEDKIKENSDNKSDNKNDIKETINSEEKSNYPKKKDSTTIIINNNINISIENRTKNIKIPQLNLNKNIFNSSNIHYSNKKPNTQRNNNIFNNINYNNNSNTARKSINNTAHKIFLNKKVINKSKKKYK